MCIRDSQQTDGMAMGSPLGPSFANAFLAFHEVTWLENCPLDFKPLLYLRYVDDCFVLFREREHANLFLEHLNNKHPNIRFTKEEELDGKLPFLDVFVQRRENKFHTSIYRKPTSTSLGTSYFSSIPFGYKRAGIYCRIDRAYKICSNWLSFHKEMDFLRTFFTINLFPPVSYTHLRAHETPEHLVCRLLLEK